MLAYIPLILTTVCLGSAAQILLKHGMMRIGRFDIGAEQLAAILPRVALSPFIIAGVACYAVSFGLWLIVLSRVDLSAAYPFLSIGFVTVTVAGYWLFGEPIGPARLAGIALIGAGLVMISRS